MVAMELFSVVAVDVASWMEVDDAVMVHWEVEKMVDSVLVTVYELEEGKVLCEENGHEAH